MRTLSTSTHHWVLGNNKIARLPVDAIDNGVMQSAVQQSLLEHGFAEFEAPKVFGLTAVMTSRCNLACDYCFQNVSINPTTMIPERIPAASWDPETIMSVVRFVQDSIDEHSLDGVELLLFGGEPLLVPKRCEELMVALQPLNLHSTSIVTNGVLCDRVTIERLRNAGLKRIQITIDGSPVNHDRVRVGPRREPSYQRILANMAACSAVDGLSWQVRVNVGRERLCDTLPVITDLARAARPDRTEIYFALLRDYPIEGATNTERLPISSTEVDEWVDAALAAGFEVLAPSAGFCTYCTERNGRFGAVIGADGFLYSCWETADRPEWRVGHPRSGYLQDQETVVARWKNCGQGALPHQNQEGHVEAFILDALRKAKRL